MKIHFICRGNVLRSLIAETYVRSLNIKDVQAISSGTCVSWEDPLERTYFERTVKLLTNHGLAPYVKQKPDQLTQARLDEADDIVVVMNQRVEDEAKKLLYLPPGTQVWNITDVGETGRTDTNRIGEYEEQIYHEIVLEVDEFVATL